MEDLDSTIHIINPAEDSIQLTTEVETEGQYCQFTIEFTMEDWKRFLPTEEGKIVRRLEGGWTSMFYEKILDATGQCRVTFVKNRIKKQNSRKHSCPYFVAGAKCKIHRNETFRIIIQEEPTDDQDFVIAVVGVKAADEPLDGEQDELLHRQLFGTPKMTKKNGSLAITSPANFQTETSQKRAIALLHSPNFREEGTTDSNIPKKLPKLSPNETFCVHMYNVLRNFSARKQVHCRHRLNEVLSQFELDEEEQ